MILSGDSSGGNRDKSKLTPHGHTDDHSTAAPGTVDQSFNDMYT